MESFIRWAEEGRVPDALVRAGIRRLLARRLAGARAGQAQPDGLQAFIAELRRSPVAVATPEANAQHYALPPAFFRLMLGPRLKYSACLWEPGADGLAAAEDAMLALTCERAGLADGMDVLELGCGWGSLSLWMAERYPRARILAVTNSDPQRAFVEARRAERGLANLAVQTADMNTFAPGRRFDRVVSVEMFEHMRNWEELLRRIAGWLTGDGRLFFHVFCHREFAYLFETRGAADWMGRYFFTGGMMPCERLPLYLQRDLILDRHFRVNGRHYAKTLRAWLARLDAARAEARAALRGAYGPPEAARWYGRWRMFLMACEELFAYRGGEEWFVGHYLMRPRPRDAQAGERGGA